MNSAPNLPGAPAAADHADNVVRRAWCAPLPALHRRTPDRRRSPDRIAPRAPTRAMAIAAGPADFALERFSCRLPHGGVLLSRSPIIPIGRGLPPLKFQQLSGHGPGNLCMKARRKIADALRALLISPIATESSLRAKWTWPRARGRGRLFES